MKDNILRLVQNPVQMSVLAWCLLSHPVMAQQAPAASGNDRPAASGDALNDEIVVTATLRAAGAQSVPIPLTAVSGAQLSANGITGAGGLAQVAPSLMVNESISPGSPRFSLRGLASGDLTAASSPSIATYIDDVVQTALYGVGSSLFDLQRVEVLRGPQGTTFGKNTTGGTVSYFTQTPTDEAEGYISARLAGGDRPEHFIEGAVNVPIIADQLAARVSFRAEEQEDFRRNIGPDGGKRGGGHSYSGRAQLRWTPDEATMVNLSLYASRGRYDQRPNVAVADDYPTNLVIPTNPDRTEVNYTPGLDLYDNFSNQAATLRIAHEINSALSLTSISHYRRTTQDLSQDLDGDVRDLFYYRDESVSKQYGQELRLAFEASPTVRGILGAYYERDTIRERSSEASTRNGPFGGADTFPNLAGVPQPVYDFSNPGYYYYQTNTYAVYGNLTVEPIESVSITGGLRYTVERKKFSGTEFFYGYPGRDFEPGDLFFDPSNPPGTPDQILPFAKRVNAKPVTWDITVDYNPHRDLLLFARVAKGVRSGGFNQPAGFFPWSPIAFLGPVPPAIPEPPIYNGESVQSYELGVKSTLFGGVRVNATVYHYDYDDQQVTTFPAGILLTTNAASSTVDGAELEVSTTRGRLDLQGSLSYNRARYSTFLSAAGDPACQRTAPTVPCSGPPFLQVADFSGNTLSQAPEWTANWGVGYLLPVSNSYGLRLATNWSYRSRIFFTQDNREEMSDKERFIGNLRATLTPENGKGVTIAGFVNNLTNVRMLNFAFDAPAPGYDIKYFGIGRTYGLDLTYRW